MSVVERRAMIEPDHARLSIAAQCRLVSIGRFDRALDVLLPTGA